MCEKAGIEVAGEDRGITQLFRALRDKHPAFAGIGKSDEQLHRVAQAMATIVDALNPLRNQASLAHPNTRLLEEPEAMLVINSVRTLLQYIDSRVR